MRLGIRGKLFAVSVVAILVVVAGSSLYLRSALGEVLTERIEKELRVQAEIAAEIARTTPTRRLDALADRLERVTGLRTTFIDAGGRVLGDSSLEGQALASIEDHQDRPEVAAALATGHGSARRYSSTVRDELEYVALSYDSPDGRRIVRVAKPLAEVDQAIGSVLWLVFIAGGLALVIAVIMSGLASYLMSRTLRSLVNSATQISEVVSEEGERVRLEVDGVGELQGLAGSFNQMAEQVESTVAALARERALVKAVLKGMSEAVVALDEDRHITLMNPAAVELLGLKSVPKGRSILEVLRAPGLQRLVGDSPVMGPGSEEFELQNGRHVLARIRPQKGGVGGSVLVMHDVTDIRRLETVRRDFVANVSHELRTPVAIIRANSETLLDGAAADPKFGRTLLEALHRNAERLSHIIDDLLDLSRIEAGQYEVELESVSVASIAEDAAKSIERSAAEKDIAIEVDVGKDKKVAADTKALEQVLFNLLDNAVKYTPEGGLVRVTCEGDGMTRRILIADNGPGIEPRHRERVFERFYRVDPGRSRNMGGTGLGLAIVRHLVEAMGGQVSVKGARPHGSVFQIELTAADALADDDEGDGDGDGNAATEAHG